MVLTSYHFCRQYIYVSKALEDLKRLNLLSHYSFVLAGENIRFYTHPT